LPKRRDPNSGSSCITQERKGRQRSRVPRTPAPEAVLPKPYRREGLRVDLPRVRAGVRRRGFASCRRASARPEGPLTGESREIPVSER
jgi:hypothetical protein